MSRYSATVNRLRQQTRDIIQFKRETKRRYGPKSQWPPDAHFTFDRMKERAAELREIVDPNTRGVSRG